MATHEIQPKRPTSAPDTAHTPDYQRSSTATKVVAGGLAAAIAVGAYAAGDKRLDNGLQAIKASGSPATHRVMDPRPQAGRVADIKSITVSPDMQRIDAELDPDPTVPVQIPSGMGADYAVETANPTLAIGSPTGKDLVKFVQNNAPGRVLGANVTDMVPVVPVTQQDAIKLDTPPKQ